MTNRISPIQILLLACLLLAVNSKTAQAQQDIPDELKPSLDAITQNIVTSTVTFLSSDEMRGRDTPSPELTIASSYVAARFRGAGLKGLGEDGSYFQNHEIATSQISSTGIVVTRDGTAVEHFGMLSADSDPYSFSGEVTMIADDAPRDAKYTGPVCIVAEKFQSRRDQSNLMRSLVRLRQNGATAILVQVDPDHRLVSQAAASSKPKMVRSRGGASGHVLLIGKTEVDGKFELNLPKQTGGKSIVRNVIGMIPGSDPELGKEAIIISAHLDHIGLQGNVGDTICNGGRRQRDGSDRGAKSGRRFRGIADSTQTHGYLHDVLGRRKRTAGFTSLRQQSPLAA